MVVLLLFEFTQLDSVKSPIELPADAPGLIPSVGDTVVCDSAQRHHVASRCWEWNSNGAVLVLRCEPAGELEHIGTLVGGSAPAAADEWAPEELADLDAATGEDPF